MRSYTLERDTYLQVGSDYISCEMLSGAVQNAMHFLSLDKLKLDNLTILCGT